MNAGDVMSKTVIGVREDAPLAQALRLMLQNRISGLPALDPVGRPVGILTEGDLLRRAELGTLASRVPFGCCSPRAAWPATRAAVIGSAASARFRGGRPDG